MLPSTFSHTDVRELHRPGTSWSPWAGSPRAAGKDLTAGAHSVIPAREQSSWEATGAAPDQGIRHLPGDQAGLRTSRAVGPQVRVRIRPGKGNQGHAQRWMARHVHSDISALRAPLTNLLLSLALSFTHIFVVMEVILNEYQMPNLVTACRSGLMFFSYSSQKCGRSMLHVSGK